MLNLMIKKGGILNCTIIVNCGAHTVTYDKITKNSFNKNNVATIRNKCNFNKVLNARPCKKGLIV